MAPVDLNQWMDWEGGKSRRLQWLKEMGWDQVDGETTQIT